MNRDTFVYWLYNAQGDCLYVGMTKQPEARWSQHCVQRPMMVKQVASRRMAGPYQRGVAADIEASHQARLAPLYDRIPESRFGVWHSLRVVRERSGWASADLARNTTLNEKPMSPGYLSDLENGKRWPNPKVIAALARALNVPYTVLERHDAPEGNSAA